MHPRKFQKMFVLWMGPFEDAGDNGVRKCWKSGGDFRAISWVDPRILPGRQPLSAMAGGLLPPAWRPRFDGALPPFDAAGTEDMVHSAPRRAKPAGVLFLLLPLAACAVQHVRFTREGGNPPFAAAEHSYPQDGFQEPGHPDFLRIAFDRNGDLYPDPAETPIDDALLARCHHSLRAYFGGIGHLYDPEELARRLARRIEAACDPGKTLLLLIHGANNSYPEARRSYELVRLRIQELTRDPEIVFLEVYWDALHGDPLASWGPARETSKWVGLGLRRILRHLPASIPLRVLAHSRGASAISAALWDVSLREDREADSRYRARQRAEPPPVALQVRLGLLAPAMGEEDLVGTRGLERVIVGLNVDDPVLGKGIVPAAWFGDTRLGCSREAFDAVAARLGDVARLIDLSSSEVHDFKDYLLRRAFADSFLPLLIGTGAEEVVPVSAREPPRGATLARFEVSSTRRELPVAQSPSTLTLIPGDEFRLLGARFLADGLRSVTGLEVSRFSSTESNVAVRGFNDDASALQGILGLLDGRQVNNEFFGSVVWDILPVTQDDVERIEVIRGPGSFVHGPNAMHGLVNIITRSPMRYPQDEVHLSGAAGSYGSTQSTLTYVKRERTSAFKARMAWDDMDEFSSPHRNARNKAFAEARFEKWIEDTPVHSIDVTAGVNQQRFDTLISQFAGVPAVEFFNSVQESYGKVNYRWGDLKAQTTWTHFLGVAEPEQIYTPFKVRNDMVDVEVQYSLQPLGGHILTAGTGYRYASFDTDLDDGGKAGLGWVFAEDQFTLAETLFVTFGGRLDWHSVAGTAASPRLAAVWEFEPGHFLRGTAGYGFRNPSLRELFFEMPLAVAPGVTPVVHGNRDLEAEKIRSVELAYRWRESDSPTRAEVIGYYNLVDRVVEFHPTAYYPSPPLPPGTPSIIEPVNSTQYKAYGLEVDLEHELNPSMSLFAGYAYGIRLNRETGERSHGAPRHKATGGLRLSLWGDLSARLWLTFFDDVEFRDAATGASTGSVDRYVLVNGRVSFEVLKGDTKGTVFLQAFNMLDHDHREHPQGDRYGVIVTGGFELAW